MLNVNFFVQFRIIKIDTKGYKNYRLSTRTNWKSYDYIPLFPSNRDSTMRRLSPPLQSPWWGAQMTCFSLVSSKVIVGYEVIAARMSIEKEYEWSPSQHWSENDLALDTFHQTWSGMLPLKQERRWRHARQHVQLVKKGVAISIADRFG